MGVDEIRAKYEQLLSEVSYLESFWPKGLGRPRIDTRAIWKSDIAGFTAATDDALKQGQLATAKWVRRIGDEIYGSFDLLLPHGANIQYHEGDAGIAIFDTLEGAIYGATAVKDAINKLKPVILSDKTDKQLKLRQGIATGKVFTAVVGDETRKIPVIDGIGLEDSYEMETIADKDGIVCVDEATYQGLKDKFKFTRKEANSRIGYELAEKPTLPKLTPRPTEQMPKNLAKETEYLEQRKQELLAFFPPLARAEVYGKTGAEAPTAKTGNAAIMFAKLPTLAALVEHHSDNPDKMAESYGAHFKILRDLIETENAGEIDKLYLGKVIARFRDNYEDAANHTAAHLAERIARDYAIRELLAEAGITIETPPIGYYWGEVIIGPTGTERRRAFTMLGDRVNRAARLMMKSKEWSKHNTMGLPKEPIPLTNIQKANKFVVKTEPDDGAPGEKKLKGIHKSIDVYTTPPPRDKSAESMTVMLKRKTLIGRDAEQEKLRAIAKMPYEQQSIQVNITSEAGGGKTELTKRFEELFSQLGRRHSQQPVIYHASTAEQAKDIPDYLFQDFIRNALGVKAETAREEIKAKLDVLPEETRKIVHHWLGFNLGYEKPAQTGPQLEEARRKSLLDIIEEGPKLLVFNDVHWADEASIDRIEWLATQLPNAIITTNYRPIQRQLKGTTITLGPFNRQAIAQHICYLLTNQIPHDELIKFVEKHSTGTPLIIEELMRYLHQQGHIKDGKLTKTTQEIEEQLGKIEFEDRKLETIEKLTLQRYRNLRNAEMQAILDYASCMFGEEFPKRLLEATLGKKELDATLLALEHADFLKRNNGSVTFKHNLVKNAIRKCIPDDQRRKMHTTVGDRRKELYGEGDDQIVALAWDYENGESDDKALQYLLLAERLFVEGKQNTTGISYAGKIQKRFDTIREPTTSQVNIYGTSLNGKGIAYKWLRRFAEAEEALNQGMMTSEKLPENLRDALQLKLHLNFCTLYPDDFERNKPYYDTAIQLAQKTGNRYIEGILKVNVGKAIEGEERIKLTEEGVALLNEFGKIAALALAYNNLTFCYKEKGLMDKAKEAGENACKIADEIKDVDLQGRSRYGLGMVYDVEGNYEQAENLFVEAERFLERIEAPTILSLYETWVVACTKARQMKTGLDVCERWQRKCQTEEDRKKLEEKKKELLALS
ncbi:Adenylate and Guanylate cyclase catalytic domain protein [uncultured archaeon]|nr:Adenylate and Guanylate cyclase catalytic domain protein [uncultured archaeon]